MKSIFLGLFLLIGILAQAAPRDSIGVRIIQGRMFIQHKVIKKETAYAISQRYKVPLDTLYAFNPGLKSLKIGDVVQVPSAFVVQPADVLEQAHANADAGINSPVMKHKVVKGETLNKIAQLYAVQVADLQKWNNLKEGKIESGQWLIVNAAAAIVPYKPWNRNREVPIDSINTLVLDPSVDEVSEMGLARVDHVVKQALVKGLPEGGYVLISNIENNKQVLIRAEKTDGRKLEDGTLIYVNQLIADQLGGDRNGLLMVSLRYLIIQP